MSRQITFRVNISSQSEPYDFGVSPDNTWGQFKQELIRLMRSIYELPDISSDEIIVTHTLSATAGVQISLTDDLSSISIRNLIMMGILKSQFNDVYILDVDTWMLDDRKESMLKLEPELAQAEDILRNNLMTNYTLKVVFPNNASLDLIANDDFTINDVLNLLYQAESLDRLTIALSTRNAELNDISVTLGQLKAMGQLDSVAPVIYLKFKPRGRGYGTMRGG